MKNLIIGLIQIVVSGLGTINLNLKWKGNIKTRIPVQVDLNRITGDFAKKSLILFLISIVVFILLCIFKNKMSKRASKIIAIIQVIYLLLVIYYETIFYRALMVI